LWPRLAVIVALSMIAAIGVALLIEECRLNKKAGRHWLTGRKL
jgi:hypothetical protein